MKKVISLKVCANGICTKTNENFKETIYSKGSWLVDIAKKRKENEQA